MKIEVTSTLIAETEQEAKILAELLNRIQNRWGHCKKVWRLTLPGRGGKNGQ